jgi:hypothetical protein
LATGVTLALALAAFTLPHAPASSAGASTTKATSHATAFYLDVGGSDSLGYEATGIASHPDQQTNTGYADDLVLREHYQGVTLTLDHVGCAGDTVQSMLTTTESDGCYQPPQTQLTTAVSYLASQSGPGLVTIDLGSGEVQRCLEDNPVNQACLAAGIHAIRVDLPKILKQLKAAAKPGVHFVGVEYFDPFLAYYLKGPGGPARAAATLVGVDRLNTVLAGLYTKAGMKVADVPTLFQMNNAATVTLDNLGTMPINVQQACELSWMCYPAPFGPIDSPDNPGYSLIAAAIEAVLPKSW